MKARLITGAVLGLLLSVCVPAQQVTQGITQGSSETGVSANSQPTFKEEVSHRIALAEAGLRQAESMHVPDVELARLYGQLGLMYEDVGQMVRAEAMLQHAVSLLRHAGERNEDLATAVSRLGNLHVVMGKYSVSEGEEVEALKLRQKLGDPLQIARSWSDLAALSIAQHKFANARDFAQKAITEFAANAQAEVIDRIAARYALSLALCYLKECPSAVPLLKDAIEDAKASQQVGFPTGLGDFLLGFAYWKSGDIFDAGQHMKEGTTVMGEQLGWSHPTYLSALKKYAQFLRENQQADVANVVEARIRQAEAVVDVHSIQTAQGMFGVGGLR